MLKRLFTNLLILNSFALSPVVYNLGQEVAYANTFSNGNFNFDEINVSYDLRLLFGDKNNDGEISNIEFKNFNFDELVNNLFEGNFHKFKFLTFKADGDNLYIYFLTDFELNSGDMLMIQYSDSITMKSDYSGYEENSKSKSIQRLNCYKYGDYYFYKGKISNFVSGKQLGDQIRVKIDRFTYGLARNPSEMDAFYDLKQTELIYAYGTEWTEGNFYYFQNNTYAYKGHLAMALGVIETENYYPVVSAFYVRSNEAKESTVKSAKEITYLFVDFDDALNLSDLISIDVEYNKIQYDYVRYTPYYDWSNNTFLHSAEEYDYTFGDIYAGLYESSEYGNLSNGISLNGKKTELKDYNESVLTFDENGESIEKTLNYDEFLDLSDDSGNEEKLTEPPFVKTKYNPKISTLTNGFENVNVLNNGKPYKKTINSNYVESDYTYEQVDNASTYWKHTPYKRNYAFKPIINLSTYEKDLSESKFDLSREFIGNAKSNLMSKNPGFNPDFAVLIDGSNSDINCDRTVNTEDTILIEEGTTMPSSGTNQDYEYSLKKNVTRCHEIYNCFVIEATAREDNGDLITFNCLGDPSFIEYTSFVGHEAPALTDLILNDVENWFNELIDPIKYTVWIILGVVIALIVFWILKKIIGLFKGKKVKVKIESENKKRK